MKNKNYLFDAKIHNREKLTRCMYTEGYFSEVNNPVSPVVHLDLPGELTLDEKVQRIMAKTLAKKLAIAERNSVESIEDAHDFEIDESEGLTPFEVAAHSLEHQNLIAEVQTLNEDDEIQANENFIPPTSDETSPPLQDDSTTIVNPE